MDLEEKIDPKHTALLIVDIQNDFCADDGIFGRKGKDLSMVQEMVRELERFMKKARKAGVKIVFTQNIYNGSTPETEKERILRDGLEELCKPDSHGSDFYRIKPMGGEKVIVKHTYSAFTNPELDKWLKENNIKTIVVTGVSTHVCVESTLRDGFFLGYYIIVPKDLVATRKDQLHLHNNTLENVQRYFGVVTDSDKILNVWSV